MKLTEEQEAILESKANTLVVKAYAGCGKTSTLVQYAKRRPNKRFMYLAFNRAIKEEAASKFPSNVKCVTTHGLAYSQYGTTYQHKLGNTKPHHIASALNIGLIDAGHTLEVVTNFLCSTDKEITDQHLLGVSLQPGSTGPIVDAARKTWAMMQDGSNLVVPIPHDGYLKLYQMSDPVINRYDILMMDEAQDSNPVTLDIVTRQRCGKVFVGDDHQSIYGFRKSVNALDRINADETLYLTASFRFGEGIANLASALLFDWKGEGKPVRGFGPQPTVFSVSRDFPHAILARTNGGLFSEAVNVLQSGHPFGFVGGVENYRFDAILDAYYLYARLRGQIRDKFISGFDDFALMKLYGEQLDDHEIKSLVNVVEQYTHEIPSLIEQLRARAAKKLTGKEIVLTTAHKAKGMEWENVVLVDDYAKLEMGKDDNGSLIPPDKEEINIIYVAITRALRGLQVNSRMVDWIKNTGRFNLMPRRSGETTSSVAYPQTTGAKVVEIGVRPQAVEWMRRTAMDLREGRQLPSESVEVLIGLLESVADKAA